MYVSFELSMPGNNAWNGKWTGEGKRCARVMNVGTSKAARAKWEKLIGHHSYSFGDGWRASITVRECTSAAARKIKKDSLGFCGYDWMIASLRHWGRILAEPPTCSPSRPDNLSIGSAPSDATVNREGEPAANRDGAP